MTLWYHRTDDYKWIHGSIRQDLEPDERSVWADFLALAGLSREPRRGYIERSQGIPYPKQVLICMLAITEDLFDRTVAKCTKEGRLQILPDGTMRITNWLRYNNVEDWHNKKAEKSDKKVAKSVAIDKAKRTKHTVDNIAQSTTQAVNRLNSVVGKLEDKVNNLEVKSDEYK